MLVLYSPINLGSARETKKLQPAPRFMCFSKGLGFLVILEFSRVFLLPQEHMCPSLRLQGTGAASPYSSGTDSYPALLLEGALTKKLTLTSVFPYRLSEQRTRKLRKRNKHQPHINQCLKRGLVRFQNKRRRHMIQLNSNYVSSRQEYLHRH